MTGTKPLPAQDTGFWVFLPLKFYGEFLLGMIFCTLLSALAQYLNFKPLLVLAGALMLLLPFACIAHGIYRIVKRRRQGPLAFGVVEFFAFFGIAVLPSLIIFGILGAVALPNFARYQAKARQSEAKVALAALGGAEKSAYAEHTTFTYDLVSLFRPGGLTLASYVVGIPPSCLKGTDPSKSRLEPTTPSRLLAPRKAEVDAALQSSPCQASPQGFEAYAIGVACENCPLDIWRIDETNTLTNVQAGLPSPSR
jgi:type II secretory pathway pseudopilin PulG